MKYYLVKFLTNTQGQDGSSIAVFADDENKSAHDKALIHYHQTLSTYHNADDVQYAVVMIVNEYGNTEIKEILTMFPLPNLISNLSNLNIFNI